MVLWCDKVNPFAPDGFIRVASSILYTRCMRKSTCHFNGRLADRPTASRCCHQLLVHTNRPIYINDQHDIGATRPPRTSYNVRESSTVRLIYQLFTRNIYAYRAATCRRIYAKYLYMLYAVPNYAKLPSRGDVPICHPTFFLVLSLCVCFFFLCLMRNVLCVQLVREVILFLISQQFSIILWRNCDARLIILHEV